MGTKKRGRRSKAPQEEPQPSTDASGSPTGDTEPTKDLQLVTSSLEQAENSTESLPSSFYQKLALANPTVATTLGETQTGLVLQTLSRIVQAMANDDLQAVTTQTKVLANLCNNSCLQGEHLQAIENALMASLAATSDALTPQTRHAWSNVYGDLARRVLTLMQEGSPPASPIKSEADSPEKTTTTSSSTSATNTTEEESCECCEKEKPTTQPPPVPPVTDNSCECCDGHEKTTTTTTQPQSTSTEPARPAAPHQHHVRIVEPEPEDDCPCCNSSSTCGDGTKVPPLTPMEQAALEAQKQAAKPVAPLSPMEQAALQARAESHLQVSPEKSGSTPTSQTLGVSPSAASSTVGSPHSVDSMMTRKQKGVQMTEQEAQKSVTLRVAMMCCEKEYVMVDDILKTLPGISNHSVNLIGRLVFIDYDARDISTEHMVAKLNDSKLGVSVHSTGVNQGGGKEPLFTTKDVLLFILRTVAFAAVILITVINNQTVVIPNIILILVSLATMGICGYKLFYNGFNSLLYRRIIDINCLMTIAVIGSIAEQQWFDGCLLLWIASLAFKLEDICMVYINNALADISFLDTKLAVLAEPGRVGETVAVEQVSEGTMLQVRAGDQIPLDGIVLKGQVAVDESSITGESKPIQKAKDDAVKAGSIVQNGYAEMKTTSLKKDSTISKVRGMVARATASKTNLSRMIDRIAMFYTPVILIVAICILIFPPLLSGWSFIRSLHEGLVILVLACPCSLVIATPIVIVCSITSAARKGVLVKSGEALEKMGAVTTIGMDKTGTLTNGHFGVISSMLPYQSNNTEHMKEVIKYAAAIESKSSHPLANAIVSYLTELEGDACLYNNIQRLGTDLNLPKTTDVKVVAGQGVVGNIDGKFVGVGNSALLDATMITLPEKWKTLVAKWMNGGQTVVYVVIEDQVEAVLGLMDSPRDIAFGTVANLKALNVDPVLLTGDSTETALATSKHVGIQGVHAQLLPEDKLKWIQQMQQLKKTVAMVGDGINDGPALAMADIGIAMGAGGTSLACDAANVILLNDRIELIPGLIQKGRTASVMMWINICLSIGIKAIALAVALIGDIPLWGAILVDMGTLVLVLLLGLTTLSPLRDDIKPSPKEDGDTVIDIEGKLKFK